VPPKPPESSANPGVTTLVNSLKSDDVIKRRRAAADLSALGVEARPAIPALREVLKDDDADVRMWAAFALVNNRVAGPGVAAILIEVLQHENPALRRTACLSLALISYGTGEDEPVVAALNESAGKDESEEVRHAASSALMVIASEKTPPGR